jgi:excisionase family DNA binding protein
LINRVVLVACNDFQRLRTCSNRPFDSNFPTDTPEHVLQLVEVPAPLQLDIAISPRCLSVAEAAAYVGLSSGAFEKAVSDGRIPGPVKLGSTRRVWDRARLDQWLDEQSGLASRDRSDEIMAAITGAQHGRGTA